MLAVEIPEDVVVVQQVAFTLYIDRDGDQGFHVFLDGDAPYSTVFGLIELGKQSIINDWNDEQPEDDDKS